MGRSRREVTSSRLRQGLADENHYMRRAARLGACIAVSMGLLLSFSAQAFAYTPADRDVQLAYVKETVGLTYIQFLERKRDFVSAKCRPINDAYVYSGGPTPESCTKPSPYNAFDWTDDGCSGRDTAWLFSRAISNAYRDLFNGPCQLHDFGYRNLGKGLSLQRNEETRAWIDGRFLSEMNRLCDETYRGSAKLRCRVNARTVYSVVRVASSWRPSELPVKQLPPPLQFND